MDTETDQAIFDLVDRELDLVFLSSIGICGGKEQQMLLYSATQENTCE